jgi:hypothetical protein
MGRIELPPGGGTERSRLWALAPDFEPAVRAITHAAYEAGTLPARLRELARFRIAVVNACPI